MSSKTKIVVLHMKEIVYTAIFAVLAIVLIILLIFMFRPKSRETSAEADKCTRSLYVYRDAQQHGVRGGSHCG